MFCVRCGREALLVEALCSECYLQAHKFITLPKTVTVEVCSHCGARHRGESWGNPLSSLEPAILAELRENVAAERRVDAWELTLEGGEHDPTNFEYDVIVRGTSLTVPFEVKTPVVVHIQKSTCTRCGRRSGGYFESILQLRAEARAIEPDERDQAGRIIERVMADMKAGGDLDSFIVKAKEVKGGFDFYFGTVHGARIISKALSNELGATLKETASLVGRDKTGIDLYRVTIAVKLPPARIGGFVALDGILHLVAAMTSKTVVVVGLDGHRRETKARHEMDGAPVLAPKDVVDAVVVSESAKELQLLDPETLRTVDLVRPPGFPQGLGSVRVIRWADRLWLLPADKLT